MKRLAAAVTTAALAVGCAQMNDAMTPSVRVSKDAFDGGTRIEQPNAGASSSLSEHVHSLAMLWHKGTPDRVTVTVGAMGTRAISGVTFNVNGTFITAQPLHAATDFSNMWSYKHFSMSVKDFRTIATAKNVKMRVESPTASSVSSFGTGSAIIDTKMAPFLDAITKAGAPS